MATIDNFQGEEADIVIASLVRANKAGNIGFLDQPERANVLLSRARCGLILIGHRHTLENCSKPNGQKIWKGYFQHLDKERAGKCTRHCTALPLSHCASLCMSMAFNFAL